MDSSAYGIEAMDAAGVPTRIYGVDLCHAGRSFDDYLQHCFRAAPSSLLIMFASFAVCGALEITLRLFAGRMFAVYEKLSDEDRVRWCNKMVSTIHALVSTAAAMWILMDPTNTANKPFSFGHSLSGERVLMISAGYMIYDITSAVVQSNVAPIFPSMIYHHIASFIGLFVTASYRVGIHTTAAMLATEITTPFMQVRWFLAKLGYTKSDLVYKLHGLTSIVLFFVVRIIGNGWLVYQLYVYAHEWVTQPLYVVFPGLVPVGILVLNAFWMYLILKLAVKPERDAHTEAVKQKKLS